MKRIALKLFVVAGLAGAGALYPNLAHADPPIMARCVWYNNGDGCFKGCDAWIFTTCSTTGGQGCYENGSGCS